MDSLDQRLCRILQISGPPKDEQCHADDSVHKSAASALALAPPPSSSPSSIPMQHIDQCHCYQLEKWDCGVACLIMVDRWLRLEQDGMVAWDDGKAATAAETAAVSTTTPLSPIEQQFRTDTLNDMATNESIWTPDLVWQLHRWQTMDHDGDTCQQVDEQHHTDSNRHHCQGDNDAPCAESSSSSTNADATMSWISSSLASLARRTGRSSDGRPGHSRYDILRLLRNKLQRQRRRRHKFDFVLCSNNLDHADEMYEQYEYYQNGFADDSHRVKMTFQLLERHGVDMILTTSPANTFVHASATIKDRVHSNPSPQNEKINVLSIDTIVHVLKQRDCIAIVLLDNSILTRGATPTSNMTEKGTVSVNASDTRDDSSFDTQHKGYTGHYVILCGVSSRPDDVQSSITLDHDVNWDDGKIPSTAERHVSINTADKTKVLRSQSSSQQDFHRQEEQFCFIVMNPAPGSDPIVFISPRRFESSWRANGTDEDIIFIKRCHTGCHVYS